MATKRFLATLAGEPQTSVSVQGQTFKVIDGIVEVPDTFEKQMLTTGFKLAPPIEEAKAAPVGTAAPVAPVAPKADEF